MQVNNRRPFFFAQTAAVVGIAFITSFLLPPESAHAQASAVKGPGNPKLLDEGRARWLIARAVQTQGFWAPPGNIVNLMSRSMLDYSSRKANPTPIFPEQELVMQRLTNLIKEKLVIQRTYVETYPDLSGDWEGSENGYYFYKMHLEQAPGTNRVSGTCEQKFGGNVFTGALQGTVDASGRATLTPLNRDSCIGRMGEIDYQYTEQGTTASIQQTSWGHVVFSGRPAAKMTVTTYDCAFSPEVRISSGQILYGRYEVGEVSNLLLNGETRAEASFGWRVSLNKLGSLMLGQQPTGSGTAAFAKKPDGTWVLVPPIRF